MKKKVVLFSLVVGMMTFGVIPAFAEGWKQDEHGYWYERYDGSYPKDCTEWIDGNADGVYEQYVFDKNGYMLANQEIDEIHKVDASGVMYIVRDGEEPNYKIEKNYDNATFVENDGYIDPVVSDGTKFDSGYHLINGHLTWFESSSLDFRYGLPDGYIDPNLKENPSYDGMILNRYGQCSLNGVPITTNSETLKALIANKFEGTFRLVATNDDGGYTEANDQLIEVEADWSFGPMQYQFITYDLKDGKWVQNYHNLVSNGLFDQVIRDGKTIALDRMTNSIYATIEGDTLNIITDEGMGIYRRQ